MSKIIRNTLILTIITVVAGLGLGLVYEVTKEPIARTEEQAKKEAWQTVFSDVSLEDFKAVEVDKEAAEKIRQDSLKSAMSIQDKPAETQTEAKTDEEPTALIAKRD